jgi:O-antigen/teichoic acid export membrane protein
MNSPSAKDMSDSSTQIKKGAVLSYVSLLLTNVVAVLVTPYMLRSLGKSEYGLYMLIGAFVGYLTVLDLGLNNSVVRYVAQYRAKKDKEGEQNFLAITMMAYVGISLLALSIGAILYWNLDRIFGASLTATEMSQAKTMFSILVFNLIIALPGGAFDAIVSAYERFSYSKSFEIIRFLLRTTLLITLLVLGYKAVAIVVLDTAMNLLCFLVNIIYVLFWLRIRFVFHRFDRKLLYEIVSYSFWVFCAAILYQLYVRVGQIVLGITDGTSAVAVFSISIMIVGYYGAFTSIFNNLLLPHAIQTVTRGATERELTDLMIKIGRIQFLIASYVLGGFLLFGSPFIQLWAGKDYSASWFIALIVMIPSTLMMARSYGETILLAMNRFVVRAMYFLTLVVFSVVFGLIARNYFEGPLAMGIGMMTASIAGTVLMTLYYMRVIRIEMVRYYKEVFLDQLGPLIIAALCGWLMIFLFPVAGWKLLAVEAVAYSLWFGVLTWNKGMNSYEKQLFIETLNAVRRRLVIVS